MNQPPGSIAITGWSVHVPGFDICELIAGASRRPVPSPDRAAELVGRRGLLYKDAATRLALCAVHSALELPAGFPGKSGPPYPRTAVVASSNLGNTEAVCRIVGAVRTGDVRNVSPLDAPNASSNVTASTVAIWFRCGGPNLMVCSGATSGLDAIRLASLLLVSGRADRAIAVGVEPNEPVARTIYPGLRAGAAAVILEKASARMPGVTLVGRSEYHREAPDIIGRASAPLVLERVGCCRIIDVACEIGDTYGAMGVMQVALAAAAFETEPGHDASAFAVCGNVCDGWRSIRISRSSAGVFSRPSPAKR